MSQLYISWSGLRSHEECKAKASLLRQKKKNPLSDIRNFFHGTTVDRVMGDWLDNDPYSNPGIMPDMVRDVMDREELAALESGDGVVRWRDKGDRERTIDWCIELVRKLEPILEQQILPYEYEPHRRFRAPVQIPYLNGEPTVIYLAGEMDILVRTDELKWRVWDLKGTQDESYWRKTLGQLTFYDLAVGAMWNEGHTETTGLIQPMCKQQVINYTVTDEVRAELMQRVVRMAHDIWRREAPPRADSKFCYNCPVRHACPKFAPANPRENPRRISLIDMQRKETEREVTDLIAGGNSA